MVIGVENFDANEVELYMHGMKLILKNETTKKSGYVFKGEVNGLKIMSTYPKQHPLNKRDPKVRLKIFLSDEWIIDVMVFRMTYKPTLRKRQKNGELIDYTPILKADHDIILGGINLFRDIDTIKELYVK